MLAGAGLFPLLKPRDLKLFECIRPESERVIRIGPLPAVRASQFDGIR
jgi:hypothetical protein